MARPAWLAQFKPTRNIGIRLLLGAILIVVARATNPTFLGWGLFVVFAVLFVPIGRARSFLFSFVPYAAVWFIFTFLRSLADETVLAETLNTRVAQLERWLFGGQLPTISLQDRFFDLEAMHWYDYFLTGIHWSYFIVPHAVAVWLWLRRPQLFRHYLSALALSLAVGLCIYFLIPSDPPWLAPEPINSPSAATVYRVMAAVGEQLGGGLYEASYEVIGESNPIAAMPSIHMAITFLIVFPLFRAGRWWGIAALVYCGLMAYALVYLGEHYVVDVAVGIAITTYAWVAAGTWMNRVAPYVFSRLTQEATGIPQERRPEPVVTVH
jgi:membrane-associated phospholipid phosphatase